MAAGIRSARLLRLAQRQRHELCESSSHTAKSKCMWQVIFMHIISFYGIIVCIPGSCWAEAVTGALSDRYIIATQGKVAIQFAPQQLLNFYGKITGGGCEGGDSSKANEFIYKYGITDDTCAPFLGVDYPHGFEIAGMVAVEKVQNHMCYICDWNGECGFVPRKYYNIYTVDEYGSVKGEFQMMSEIYSRGPIACSLNSEPSSFDDYHGGIITCNKTEDIKCAADGTDHVIVIAGWVKTRKLEPNIG